MNDSRWPAADGWVKMEQKVNGVTIHYNKTPLPVPSMTSSSNDFVVRQ
jgi:hypothetical protein